jgi:hypothetical protein
VTKRWIGQSGGAMATLFGAVLFFGGGWGGAAAQVPLAEPGSGGSAPTVYGPGELLVFSIGYGLVNAGDATLEVVEIIDFQGRPCYVIESKANSNRFFSSFYKVRDRILSYIDTETLYSRYFYKRLREGDYKKNVEVVFDHDREVARYADGPELPIARGVQDVLSAFYYVRNLDLAPGRSFTVPAHDSRKTYELKVLIHGKERVTVEAGTFDCFVVEPIIEGEGLFKHEGKLTLYISDDKFRIPVMIKTKVPVGSIDVELKEFRPGAPLNPLR